jgi:non-ribosomal peptide synthetase component E (peptide arylation enzyme)
MSRRGVARYKWPEFVQSIDELPRTPMGKVNKVELRLEARRRLVPGEAAPRSER